MAQQKINNLMSQMDSFSNIENLMTPTKQNFDPNAPLRDEDREIPDLKKSFIPG